MKKIIVAIICIGIIAYTCLNANQISTYLSNIISNKLNLTINNKNEYAKNENYKFVSISNDFIPYSYNDLLNIIYTTIDYGWDTFTFYCPNEYNECINDINSISTDELTLSNINNFVHPLNSFSNIKTKVLESGEITIEIKYIYSQEKRDKINSKVDELMTTLVSSNASTYDNIKNIHDYIINNTKYDVQRNEAGNSPYESYSAYGALFDHYATCNGYTDLMAIFLTKMGIKNYKIATMPDKISYKSTGHVWNAVYLNNNWLHLDLTWDDPVSDDGQDYLYHKYFLITSKELKEADSGDVIIEEHNFNNSIYLEFNESINSVIE